MTRDTASSFQVPIKALLASGVDTKVFTAAQAAWCCLGEAPVWASAGDTGSGPVTDHTLFDLASLTKLFTASACLRLVAEGKMRLDSKIREYARLPLDPQVADAQLGQLLAHEAGFVAYLPLFEQVL